MIKKSIPFLMASAVMLSLSTDADAVPARKLRQQMPVLSGASTVMMDVWQSGDERMHTWRDADGCMYQLRDDGVLTPCDDHNTAQGKGQGAGQGKVYGENTPILASSERNARFAMRRLLGEKAFPTVGSPRIPVILVDFSDCPMTYSHEVYHDMMNLPEYSGYGCTGSAFDYYRENSSGQFTPQFDVLGPVRLPHPLSYYGANDDFGNDKAPHEMVIDACRLLDTSTDFSKYDNDGDGVVDIVYLFYAGYGENDGGKPSTVWPHSSSLANRRISLNLDGVAVNKYACSNELMNGYGSTITGIGTFCHEFTHVLGFPDLYTTVNIDVDNWTPDCWTIMDQGPYNNDGKTPPLYTAYERQYMGWLSPLPLSSDAVTSTLLPSLQHNVAYRVASSPDSNEFFLLEYRDRTGWDAYIPGSGLLVWQIDYDPTVWDANTVNNSPNHHHVRLVCADGRYADNQRPGVAYPGTAKVTSISSWPAFSTPAPSISISDIREADGLLSFRTGAWQGTLPTTSSIAITSITPRDTNALLTIQSSGNDSDSLSAILATVWRMGAGGRAIIPAGWGSRLITPTTDADGAMHVRISDLSPDSEYYVSLTPVNPDMGLGMATPRSIITTTPPGIAFSTPEAPEVLETDHGVEICWQEVASATSYLLDIYRMKEGAARTDGTSFDLGLTLPEGWTTTILSTFKVNGYYGEAAPSAVFDAAGQYIATPTYADDITSLSLWMRGRRLTDDSRLDITGKRGNDWGLLTSISPLPSSATHYSIDPSLLQGVRAIRLDFSASTGTPQLMIDDISLGFGTGMEQEYLLRDMEVADTGCILSASSCGFIPGETYYAEISASDGIDRSHRSAPTAFSLTGNVAAPSIEADSLPAEVFNLQGIHVATLTHISQLSSLPRGVYIITLPHGKRIRHLAF